MIDFRLKQFALRQSHTAMKVGTDAIVLGAWVANLGLNPRRILDIGAGTGILSLMLAQAYPDAYIDAIELDEGAALDARYNFTLSPWGERLRLYQGDALNFLPLEPYDLIISNPPFFVDNSLPAVGQSRQLARQEQVQGLGLYNLITSSCLWLNSTGYLCLISPYDRELALRQAACEALMYFQDLCVFCSRPNHPLRFISSLRPMSSLQSYTPCQLGELIHRSESGAYTEAYRKLTEPYLLD